MLQLNSSKKIAGLVLMLVTAAELLPHCTPLARGETFKALSSDSADHSCQVVLRSAQIVLNSATGLPETETDNVGRSWFAFEATVDTASAPSNLGHQFNFCTAASATQPGTQLLELQFRGFSKPAKAPISNF